MFSLSVWPGGGGEGVRYQDVGAFGPPPQEVPPIPQAWYPHEPGDPLYDVDLYLLDRPDMLQRHWELAWRDGRV